MLSLWSAWVFRLVFNGTGQCRVEVVGEGESSMLVVVVRKDEETKREGKNISVWMGIKRFEGVTGNERVGLEPPMVAMKEITD